MGGLFVLGDFVMHSGGVGHWKIECDALTNPDLECLAFMLWERLPRFSRVYGVPRGGVRLAEWMEKYATSDTTDPVLIVDDVLTTGRSMEECRQSFDEPDTIGAVIFARGVCPAWITPLFRLSPKQSEMGP